MICTCNASGRSKLASGTVGPPRTMRRFLVTTVTAAATSGMSLGAARATPPVARRAPHTVKFGKVAGENRGLNPMDPPLEIVDDLFWMRDDTRSNEEILQHLRDENEYTQARTAHLDGFRTSLYDEMLSHIQEDDDTYPSPSADGYEYWSRTVKGKSFRQHLRRRVGAPAGSEQVYLDVNTVPSLPYYTAVANWDAAQCDVRAIEPSPSGNMLAYCVDGSGYETYNIRLKDLTSGEDLEETIEATAGSVAWADEQVCCDFPPAISTSQLASPARHLHCMCWTCQTPPRSRLDRGCCAHSPRARALVWWADDLLCEVRSRTPAASGVAPHARLGGRRPRVRGQ